MAKIQHNNFVDTINDMLIQAKERGIIHLNFNGDNWSGGEILVGEKDMINFGTCGYLGLENHPKIIEEIQRYAKDYGSQFSVSRAYLTSKSNVLLEDLLGTIFSNKKVIVFSSTTIAHLAVIPIVISTDDLIILDQQVHISIQNAVQLLAAKGAKVEMIRHSNMEMLEEKIKQYRSKYRKIWYMIDGVYSMYGDIAPINEINDLMQKYDQLQLYIDDAHGMSWYGEHGCGRIFKQALSNNRTIYMSTLAKGFGCMGGVAVFPDDKTYDKVKLHGGPLSYSHPLPPPMVGAAIASSEIHLSNEIYLLQNQLKEKLQFNHHLLMSTNLPVLSNPETPINFIGTGQPVVGYKIVQQLMDEGFFVNIAMFPAVPVKNTGLRFTITNHNSKEQIEELISCINVTYNQILYEENTTINSIRQAFRLPRIDESEERITDKKKEELIVQFESDISKIDKMDWDSCFYGKGNFDHASLIVQQKGFSNNDKEEENFDFYYLVIKDREDKIIAATHFTLGLLKDDLLSEAQISKSIESRRKEDPFYLCTYGLMMGSLFSEGDHLYIDKSHNSKKAALDIIFQKVQEIQDEKKINTIIFRDFSVEDSDLEPYFHEAGYFKLKMPNSNVVNNLEEYQNVGIMNILGKRNRKNLRQDVLPFEGQFNTLIKSKLSVNELDEFYSLYLNVQKQNFAVNLFPYPKNLFEAINEDENWEFIVLINTETLKTSAILGAYKTINSYFPVVIGIDYSENREFMVYKQMLYQIMKHVNKHKYKKLFLGVTADIEKKKIGAIQIPKYAFVSIADQFNLEIIGNISSTESQ